MPYTTPRTWVAGDVLTAAQMNQDVRDNVAFLANPPACRVKRSAVQSVPNGTFTTVLFTVETYDTAGMHSTSTDTGRITFPVAGLYHVGANIIFAADNDGYRIVQIRNQATAVLCQDTRGPVIGDTTGAVLGGTFKFAAGDWAEVSVWHSAGAALDLTFQGGAPEFHATWVGLG